MKHVWQIFLFLAVLVSVCCTGCERKQAMEIEEETFPVVSSVAEESGEAYTEISRMTLFVDVRGAVAVPGVYELPEKSRVFTTHF